MSNVYSEVKNTITALQDSAEKAYGKAGHAWNSGFLGSVLVDVLYSHVSVTQADIILKELERITKRNLEKQSA